MDSVANFNNLIYLSLAIEFNFTNIIVKNVTNNSPSNNYLNSYFILRFGLFIRSAAIAILGQGRPGYDMLRVEFSVC
jgi:hypothetical protein